MAERETGARRAGVAGARISRRAVLAGLGGGVVAGGAMLGLSGGGIVLPGYVINAFIAIEADGSIVFACPAVELGQGCTTALAMIVAEEIGADLDRLRVLPAPRDPGRYGNPDFEGHMVTADSKTTRGYFAPLRLAGAQARQALIEAAAMIGDWRTGDLDTVDHAAIHRPSGRRLDFGEIAARTTPRPPHLEPAPRPRAGWRLIGTSPPLPDSRAKVTGQYAYGIDRRSPDALVAVLARAPHPGGQVIEVRDAAARAVAGVEAVVRLEDAVAVVARHTWAALEGARLLDIDWSPAPALSDATCAAALAAALADPARGTTVAAHGDVEAGLTGGARRFAFTLEAPHVSHLALEPLNAEARGETFGLGVAVRSATQSPELDMAFAARTWKTAPFMVATEATAPGGAFGRRVLNDTVRDAARVAKALGRPVQVVRPLRDELRRGQVRPAATQRIEAATDAGGTLTAWRHRIASDSVLARHIASTFEARGRIDNTATDGMRHPYRVAAEHLAWHRCELAPEPGFLRGVSAGHATFAIETAIDRIARAHGRDPLEWRLAHVDAPRGRAVLERAAVRAGWHAGNGGHRGLALMTFRDSWIVTVARLDDAPTPRLAELVIVADVGIAVHPDNVRRQIEGAAVLGLSLAGTERLVFAGGRALIDSVADYPVLRADSLVPITVELIGAETAERPSGAGELGVPTVAPAIANALARVSGTWPERLPFEFALATA